MNELTYSQKKYLFAIYKLGQQGGEVKSTEVAKIMEVSKASTAAMTDKLCEIGYIRKEYYGQIAMTDSGVKAANSFFTSYIIIRDFLENALGLDEKTADDDAVKIVVHASGKTINRLAEYLLKGSPLSFKLACKVFDIRETHPVIFETAVICATVGIMCPSMSFIAAWLYYPYYEGFNIITLLANWLKLVCFNFPFAFFSQLFFIQPLVRTLFKLLFRRFGVRL